ncbi:hypothetical protein [Humidisolicoccus flavus]|uniref:hypothetical protein n=1 Tax=Humidisolicoccus flavus TaxID=3111414 RepID=UPI0032563382
MMKTPVKLSVFALALLALFGGSYALGGLLVPESLVDAWREQAVHGTPVEFDSPDEEHSGSQDTEVTNSEMPDSEPPAHGEPGTIDATEGAKTP